jgi:hypothetical protein
MVQPILGFGENYRMNFRPQSKAARGAARLQKAPIQRESRRLLDLGFLELDVLAHDGIVFVHLELGGLGARILLGDVEVTGIRGGNELDLNDV